MFEPFVYLLRDLGLPVSFRHVMEFYEAVDKGLVTDIDRLFLVARLIFVKRVEHCDLFERAFSAYFLGRTEKLRIPDAESILNARAFQDWLEKAVEEGTLAPDTVHEIPLEELLRRFWDTLLAQDAEHHGGNRWIGTAGRSPWGHSGFAQGGIRVQGASMNRSAMKVIGQRRYLDYSGDATLSADNVRQALSLLKRMVPVGPSTELDVEETIRRTCRNGGEIELVLERELRDRIEVMLFLDNGGFSMDPYIGIVRLLFSKMRDQFRDLKIHYFHNCIYAGVYSDLRRTRFCKLQDLLQKDPETRLVIVGDANMAPSELFAPQGAIDFQIRNPLPGIESLRMLSQRFPRSVWLNPIERGFWRYQSSTLPAIAEIFRMEELTLNGLKNAVEHLSEKA